MSRSWMDPTFLWSLALAENSHRFACLRLATEKAVVGRVLSTRPHVLSRIHAPGILHSEESTLASKGS